MNEQDPLRPKMTPSENIGFLRPLEAFVGVPLKGTTPFSELPAGQRAWAVVCSWRSAALSLGLVLDIIRADVSDLSEEDVTQLQDFIRAQKSLYKDAEQWAVLTDRLDHPSFIMPSRDPEERAAENEAETRARQEAKNRLVEIRASLESRQQILLMKAAQIDVDERSVHAAIAENLMKNLPDDAV